MAELFGLDMQKTIADALKGQLRPGTFLRVTPGTRTAADPTAGTNPEEVKHTFEGFVEKREVRRPGAVDTRILTVLTVIAGSISPPAVPEVNDEVTLDGASYQLLELLSLDPGEAVYEFRTED